MTTPCARSAPWSTPPSPRGAPSSRPSTPPVAGPRSPPSICCAPNSSRSSTRSPPNGGLSSSSATTSCCAPFVGLPLDEPVFHATSFTKNRQRLLTTEIAEAFFAAIRGQAEAHKLLSAGHFSVDGTLIEAAAALKSLRPIEQDEGEEPPTAPGGRNPDVDWHGERRGNASHRSTTDPEARLARKGNGKEAKLCYAGHTLIENRNGLIVALELTPANGTAEREAGLRLLARQRRPH